MVDNTNSKNLELYSVMAEHDNAGFPLAYCMLSTATSLEIGKRKKALTRWVEKLRDTYGIRPRFAHTDKDMGEIGMLREVWDPKIQLCWWHLRKAVRERLGKSKLSTTPYNPRKARQEFTFVDVTFIPMGRPDPAEYEGGAWVTTSEREDLHPCDSPNAITLRIPALSSTYPPQQGNSSSPTPPPLQDQTNRPRTSMAASPSCAVPPAGPEKLTIRLPRRGDENVPAEINSTAASGGMVKDVSRLEVTECAKRTFCPVELREAIVDMMEMHLCAHPSIPGYSHPSKEGIREWAVKQIYQYCTANDLREVWAYLWENWYCRQRWELWARSVHEEIPRLKTTMIMESQ
jgi:hypothetical protein